MKTRARSLVGTDFAAFCKEVGAKLEAENEERLRQQRAAADKHEYEGSHVYHVIVGSHGRDVLVTSIEAFPLIGRLQAAGRNYDVAITNLRLLYARMLHKKKWLPDIDTAREYAAKCVFKVSLS
jgi:hypothetical protein